MNSNLLGILKEIKISNIVSNTNKTLGVVKKIIPVYKEIRPYVNHEKSLFKKDDKVLDNIKESNGVDVRNDSYNDTLNFFN